MTSRERVLTAIGRAEPDRVPVDYCANPEIDQGLKAHFGLADDDQEGLLRALGVDIRTVNAPYVGPKLHADTGEVKASEWGYRRRWVDHGTGGYWDYCEWPLADADVAAIDAWRLPAPDDHDYSAVDAACRAHEGFCLALGGAGTGDVINQTGMLRTMQQTLMDMITDEPAFVRLNDRRLAIQEEVLRRAFVVADGRADILWLGEDLGTQIGPMISPELFARHIRPRHQRFVDLAREFDAKVMIHTCGSSSWAFDDFIEMGIDVVDTLQPEAAEMAPAHLKRHWGDRLAFHGCISTAGPLAYGSVEDVVSNVRETLATMAPGGGYILAPTHAIQSNSPIANVVAMYAAAREYGVYR